MSSEVSGGTRYLVLRRPLAGASADHFSFSSDALSVPIIAALGDSHSLAYHKAKTAAALHLWPAEGSSVCICSVPPAPFGKGGGKVRYVPSGVAGEPAAAEAVGFQAGRCSPAPRTQLIDQRNPTCDIRTYEGGLETCHQAARQGPGAAAQSSCPLSCCS